ncbi:MAG TPA: transposase [Roseiarcus sp.]|nr:transposase [Roseiarcus sp.]
MRAAAQALTILGAERLGAQLGLIAVLHTWGQTLIHHPHVHCLVPGAASRSTAGAGSPPSRTSFSPSTRLTKTFRRLFLDGLQAAFHRGEFGFFSELAPLAQAGAFAKRRRAMRQSPFVVYAKPPFGGPERLLAYLARYTIEPPSPIRGWPPSTTKSRSPTRTIVAAVETA